MLGFLCQKNGSLEGVAYSSKRTTNLRIKRKQKKRGPRDSWLLFERLDLIMPKAVLTLYFPIYVSMCENMYVAGRISNETNFPF